PKQAELDQKAITTSETKITPFCGKLKSNYPRMRIKASSKLLEEPVVHYPLFFRFGSKYKIYVVTSRIQNNNRQRHSGDSYSYFFCTISRTPKSLRRRSSRQRTGSLQ